ncbi:DHA2 family efflux MFS transporter permease subunit [Spongiactinospora sp. TRM90649]|uniref:DHA2 family efflux MFS transporter permease subunit n=1 Tax=Spongiactinospora sp. TRM90649 TaxID=3031114 RepID=UPI0023F92E4C|nr:DHA2 family efflux MFS transporter permease subunit [Spongiactinospora sp. TRM90649]MDF5752455.1 DHA2 family efflux MFS transporter permease subunit [Spongiactinospora sp. TRM90649]
MRTKATFLITGAAAFMAALDTLVVTTALPTIRAGLGASLESLEWTVNAYTLVYAVFLLAAAALGDRFGRRRVFVAGLTVFTLASAAAALAGSASALIVARTIQGLGASVIVPLALTLVVVTSPARLRGRVIAGFGGMIGLGIALGPWIGGAVIRLGNWEAVFWINVPVGLLLIPLAVWFLPESRGPYGGLDVRGLALVVTGLFGVVFGLIRGTSLSWTHPQALGPLLAGALVLACFARWERRAAHPVLPPHLFRDRGFALSNLLAMFVQGGVMGAVFLLTQFLQNVLGYQPLEAGVRTLPWTLMPVLVAPLAGVLGDRMGVRRLMTAGALLQGIALAWFAVVASPSVGYPVLLPAMLVAGIGMGVFFGLAARQAMDFVSASEEGVASGVNNAMRQVGIVLGVAVLSSVFAAAGGYGSPAAFVSGLRPALWTATGVLAVAVVVALLVPARPATGGSPGTRDAADGEQQRQHPDEGGHGHLAGDRRARR